MSLDVSLQYGYRSFRISTSCQGSCQDQLNGCRSLAAQADRAFRLFDRLVTLALQLQRFREKRMRAPGRGVGFYRPVQIWHRFGPFVFMQQVEADSQQRAQVFWVEFKGLHPTGFGLDLVIHLSGVDTEEVFDFRTRWSRFTRGFQMITRIIGLIGPQRLQGLAHVPLRLGRKYK